MKDKISRSSQPPGLTLTSRTLLFMLSKVSEVPCNYLGVV